MGGESSSLEKGKAEHPNRALGPACWKFVVQSGKGQTGTRVTVSLSENQTVAPPL